MHRNEYLNIFFGKRNKFGYAELIDKAIMYAFLEIEQTAMGKKTKVKIPDSDKLSLDLTMAELLYRQIVNLDQRSLIYTPILSKKDHAFLLLALESEIDWLELKKADLTDERWTRLGLAMGRLSTLDVYFNDSILLNKCTILADCHRLKAVNKVNQVIFYLGDLNLKNRSITFRRLNKIIRLINRRVNLPVLTFHTTGLTQINIQAFTRLSVERFVIARDTAAKVEDTDRECLMQYLAGYSGKNEKEEWENERW